MSSIVNILNKLRNKGYEVIRIDGMYCSDSTGEEHYPLEDNWDSRAFKKYLEDEVFELENEDCELTTAYWTDNYGSCRTICYGIDLPSLIENAWDYANMTLEELKGWFSLEDAESFVGNAKDGDLLTFYKSTHNGEEISIGDLSAEELFNLNLDYVYHEALKEVNKTGLSAVNYKESCYDSTEEIENYEKEINFVDSCSANGDLYTIRVYKTPTDDLDYRLVISDSSVGIMLIDIDDNSTIGFYSENMFVSQVDFDFSNEKLNP